MYVHTYSQPHMRPGTTHVHLGPTCEFCPRQQPPTMLMQTAHVASPRPMGRRGITIEPRAGAVQRCLLPSARPYRRPMLTVATNAVGAAEASTDIMNAVSSPAATLAGVSMAGVALQSAFASGSRKYDNNVGEEYDAWTEEGVLEYYWGDHIHLGYYSEAERAAGYTKKDFKGAKLDFVDEMLKFSGATPKRVLDVGCGFGGSSRHLAALFPSAEVEGVTLSAKQVQRGQDLAKERGLENVIFKVMDALAMDYPDNSFDLVWACESGEHMPDKKKYVEEMTRVLKPGGTLVIACWCQREDTPKKPFTEEERAELQFLYDEWAHPYFISIEEFARLMEGTGQLEQIRTDDWTPQTLPSWRHSIWVGVWDPWIVVGKPNVWYKTVREIVTLERMHQAFDSGLMQYGLMAAVKKGN